MPELAEEIVEAAPVEGESSSESATEEQQEPQEGQPKPKGGFQKRIDRLTRSNTQLEQEKEYWRNEALRTSQAKETPKVTSEAKGEPSESDFGTHAEYVKALTRHYAAEALKESQTQQTSETVKAQAAKAQQEFKARQEAFKAATPDFDEVLADADDLIVSNAVIAEIVESEHGPELQYYLAKNPDEAKRLSGLAPLALAREVGKIESRFTTSEEKPASKVTGAPPPPDSHWQIDGNIWERPRRDESSGI
jgi:hypothetical protein